MKKTIYFLCLLSSMLSSKNTSAQLANIVISPQSQCYSVSGNSSVAYPSPATPGATSYSWTVSSPTTCPATVTTFSNGGFANISYPCCGIYTVTCFAFNSSNILVNTIIQTSTVSCSGAVSISQSPSGGLICSGQSIFLSGAGAQTYTWYPGGISSPSIVVTPSASTCYTLVGNSSGCGSSSATTCFSVFPQSSVSATASNDSLCTGSSATLTASGATTYTWYPGGLTGSSIVVTPTTSTSYVVVGSNGPICQSTQTINISVFPASIGITGNTNICAGTSATLTASGASSYTWYTSFGTFTSSTIVLTPSATSCFSLIGTNASGCTGYSGGCVIVSQAPSPTITSSNFNICGGSSTQLFASGASSYTWFPGGSTSPSISVSPSVTTCYTLAGFGCNGIGSTVRCVTVNPQPFLTLSGDTTICPGQSSTLTMSGAQTYSWFPGNLSGSVVVISPSVSTCYTVFGYNGSGCSSYGIWCVNVQTPPVISTGGGNFVCAGSSATLFANGAQSYTWLPGNLTGAVVAITPTVSTCYTVVGTAANGCVGLGSLCMQVVPKPIITVSGGASCAGASTTLTASGASTYTWLPFNLNGSSIVITPSVTSCYTVLGSGGSGCTNSVVSCYSVLPSPVITVFGASVICGGSSTNLTASGALSYTWLPLNVTGANVVVSPSVSTCYTVLGSNNTGCVSKVVKCITVQSGAILNISGANSICGGTSANLLASGANSYTWNTGSNSPFISVSPSVSTCYTVIGTTASGCVGSAVKCISVQAQPFISISGNTSICFGSTTTLVASGASSYQWNTGANTSAIVVSPPVSTVYIVTGSNGSCSGVKSVTVTVKPKPIISIFRADSIFNNDSILCAGNSAILYAVGGFSYTWSNGGFGSNITVSPSVTTTYTVTGIGTNGCSNSNIYTLFVSPCTGITKHDNERLEMGIYPNPSSGQIILQGNGASKINFKVYDVLGRELINGLFTDTKTIDLSSYSNGTYIIRFESGTMTSYKKLVLEK